MKKFTKRLSLLFVALVTFFGFAGSFANAQDVDTLELLTQIQEVNQNSHSAAGDISIDFSIQDVATGSITGDYKATLSPLAFDLKGTIDAEIMTQGQDGETTSMPISFPGQIILADKTLFINDGYAWTQEDASQLVEEFENVYQEAMTQQTYIQNPELMEKYYNLEETDAEYVLTMKEDINPDEFLADLESTVDLEATRQEALEQGLAQLEEQAKANGEELTDEDRQEFEEIFNNTFDASLKIGISLLDSLEMRYNKETLYLTYYGMDLSLTPELIQEIVQAAGQEETVAVPDNINIDISIAVNVDEMNTDIDIQAPEIEEATSVEETSAE